MRLLLRLLMRGMVAVLMLAVLGFGAIDLYFHFVNHISVRVQSIVMARVARRHLHYLSYVQIPVTFRDAMVATEDRRFYSDPGIDPIGIARSFVVDVEKDGYVEGGSTITQQLVDNTLTGQKKTIERKLLQAFYAIGLYDTQEKSLTFALYANDIYFGQGAYGLYAASETYFHKPPNQLNAGEVTMLAGLPNAPSLFDPYRAFSLARRRQAIVLENMVDDHILTSAQARHIFREPIHLGGH